MRMVRSSDSFALIRSDASCGPARPATSRPSSCCSLRSTPLSCKADRLLNLQTPQLARGGTFRFGTDQSQRYNTDTVRVVHICQCVTCQLAIYKAVCTHAVSLLFMRHRPQYSLSTATPVSSHCCPPGQRTTEYCFLRTTYCTYYDTAYWYGVASTIYVEYSQYTPLV